MVPSRAFTVPPFHPQCWGRFCWNFCHGINSAQVLHKRRQCIITMATSNSCSNQHTNTATTKRRHAAHRHGFCCGCMAPLLVGTPGMRPAGARKTLPALAAEALVGDA